MARVSNSGVGFFLSLGVFVMACNAECGGSQSAESGEDSAAAEQAEAGSDALASSPADADPGASADAEIPDADSASSEAPLRLVVENVNQEQIMECSYHDLAIRLMAGDAVRDEVLREGTCEGACSKEEKREGRRKKAEIERQIEEGEGVASELDYNFTGCDFYGETLGTFEELGDRRIAVIEGYKSGPHDIPKRYFVFAMELCGELFVSEEFGLTYANQWKLGDLDVELSITSEGETLAVAGVKGDEPHDLYRASLPGESCSELEEVSVDEEVLDAEPR